MAENASPMTLRLLTPTGVSAQTPCDSVQLTIRDGADGQGGGLVGIRRNHAPAVLALGEGTILAELDHKPVFRANVSGGFASVDNNIVTVITDSASVAEV